MEKLKEKREKFTGAGIKKLRLRASAGRVFTRLYEKGHPEIIPVLRAAVKEYMNGFESQAVLFYRFVTAEERESGPGGFAFLGRIAVLPRSAEFEAPEGVELPPETDMEKAAVGELLSKLKKIVVDIAGRELGRKNFTAEVEELPADEAARLACVKEAEYIRDAVGGIVPVKE